MSPVLVTLLSRRRPALYLSLVLTLVSLAYYCFSARSILSDGNRGQQPSSLLMESSIDVAKVPDAYLKGCTLHKEYGYSACYDDDSAGLLQYYKAHIDELKRQRKVSTFLQKDTCFRNPRETCFTVAVSGGETKVPIIARFHSCSWAFGNDILEYYEAASVAMELHVPFLSITLDRCEGDLRMQLPFLLLPAAPKEGERAATPSVQSVAAAVQMLRPFPHEYKASRMWRNGRFLSALNHLMVMRHFAKSRPAAGNSTAKKSLALHFRCSDNMVHKLYGLISIGEYEKVVLQNAHRVDEVRIYTDLRETVTMTADNFHANTSSINKEVIESTCRYVLNRAIERLRPLMPAGADFKVDYFGPSPSEVFQRLHSADVVVCSPSTFCFLALLGAGGSKKYYPSGHLIHTKYSVWPLPYTFHSPSAPPRGAFDDSITYLHVPIHRISLDGVNAFVNAVL